MSQYREPDQAVMPGRAGRRRGRSSMSGLRRAALVCLVCLLALCGAFYAVNAARLSDLKDRQAQQKSDYERRVYRTTVKYRDLVTRWALEYGLRPSYVAAIILNESSYDPAAVSSVGARGLMQLLPGTGKWIAGKVGLSDYTDQTLFDPETNIRLGTWYLSYLSDLYGGDPVLVACAYHAGHNNVDTWLTRYSRDGRTLRIDEIPTDNTRSYAKKVVDSFAIYLENYYQE